MCDDLVPIGNPSTPLRYPIELLACPACLTVHQKYQVEKKALFPATYHYRAAMTKDVLDGMADLVVLAGSMRGDLKGKVVLDVGCNDGSLLNIFRQRGALTIGIEPTEAVKDARNRVDHVINDFFGADSVELYLSRHPKPDIITFTNVFAHIEDLGSVLHCLRKLAKEDTTIIIENHYLGSVLSRSQFDTFYHEHPRTYSFRSFEFIARKLGMNIRHVDFPPRYNGNIRVAFDRTITANPPSVEESGFMGAFEPLRIYVEEQRVKMMDTLRSLVAIHGPLPAKAFPGRAGVIIAYFGIDESLISAAYERSGSAKIGYYIPGTRIPILDEAEFFSRKDQYPVLVNFAWHIKAEIHRYMRANGYVGDILEVFS
jgi:SAM-dependent methyltransferase